MKDNELVPIEIIPDAIHKRHNKQKSRIIGGFFITLLLFLFVMLIVVNFPQIKILFSNDDNDSIKGPVNISSDTNTSTDTSQDSSTTQPVPEVIPNGSYKIIEESFSFSSITNNTELEIGACDYEIKTANEIYTQYGKEAPVILITHSASLEAYSNGKHYSLQDNFYSYNENVGSIGKAICEGLCKLGINAIHMNEVFANGGIYSSKEEFESALASLLKRFPSIEYVFDISRDVIINDDLTMIKPVCSIGATKAAQLQIWVGTSDNTKAWQKNLGFATMLSSKNDDIVKDVILSPFSYSSKLCPVYLKLDIGAYSNTYSEALILANELSARVANLIR